MGRKYSLLLILILIPALILTACGGGGTTTTMAVQTTTPSTSAPTSTQSQSTATPPPTTTASQAAVTTTPPPATTTVTSTTTPPPQPTETETPQLTETQTPTTEPPPPPMEFILTSSAFEYGQLMPSKYSYYGENKSPPLSWSGAPEGTASFALIMEDPDGGNWSHWVIFNIPSDVFELAEGLPYTVTINGVGTQGYNDFGGMGYGGPSPPSGTHHYYFRLYALDTTLNLTPGATRSQLQTAMQGHILDTAEYMGTYSA